MGWRALRRIGPVELVAGGPSAQSQAKVTDHVPVDTVEDPCELGGVALRAPDERSGRREALTRVPDANDRFWRQTTLLPCPALLARGAVVTLAGGNAKTRRRGGQVRLADLQD